MSFMLFGYQNSELNRILFPGQPTILNFTPTKTGKYPIICAELCGPYHGGMRASIIVEEESDYNEWFNNNKKPEVNL